MNDDATSFDRGGRLGVVAGTHPVIADDRAGHLTPQLHTELVGPASTILLLIDRGQQDASWPGRYASTYQWSRGAASRRTVSARSLL